MSHIVQRGLPLAVAFILMGVATPALAVSPFDEVEVRCRPYNASFVAGYHYQPFNNDVCFFSSLPGTSAKLSIYKGAVGSGAFLNNSTITAATDGVLTTSNAFNGAVAGDQFFLVAYDATLATDFEDYFTGATSTPPSEDYHTLPFLWGPKGASEYDPVLIIPDILGSWRSNDAYELDPIFNSYQNLIDTLLANGYVEGTNLFVLPYDWQDSNVTTAAALEAAIAGIKTTCGCSHVDVVAHGMGGFAAWSYLQSATYADDVDQLVFLGTSFYGVPAAYQAWEGGDIKFGDALRNGVAKAFLTQEAQNAGETSIFNYLQNTPASSVQELLPINDYLPLVGSYPTGYPLNTFLEDLHSTFNLWEGVRVSNALGDNGAFLTPGAYFTEPSSQPPLWPHGQPSFVFLDAGDNVSPRSNIETFQTVNEVAVANHFELPTATESFTFEALNEKAPATTVTTDYSAECVLFVSVSGSADMQINNPSSLRLGKDFLTSGYLNEVPRGTYSGFSEPTEYATIVDPAVGIYTVETHGGSSGTFTLEVTDVCGDVVTTATTTEDTVDGQIITVGVEVGPGGGVTIVPVDSGAPVVEIDAPLDDASYLQNDTILPSVTITDPEDSPIATTTYTFNGSLVNPNDPLPFMSAPLGTATLEVTATDAYGNIGSALSTFTLLPPDLTPPVVTITNPSPGSAFVDTDTVFLVSTVTDTSPIVATSYSFNGDPIDPNDPLPLLGAPLGAATVSVAATDAYGNAASTTVTFTLVSPDITPPTIDVTSPVEGATYLNSAEVFVEATVTDASGIATTIYTFNGLTTDPNDPLPLSTAPAGEATLVVFATDTFGNEASTTVTFTIEAPPPPDTEGPVIVITLPVAGESYSRVDHPYLIALITDASEVVNVQYFFNDIAVDPAEPLPFHKAQLGTSTVTVIATDEYGNVGSTTIAFTIVPGVRSCLDDITDAFNHKKIKSKAGFAKYFKACEAIKKFEHDKEKYSKENEKKGKRDEDDDRYQKAEKEIEKRLDEIKRRLKSGNDHDDEDDDDRRDYH